MHEAYVAGAPAGAPGRTRAAGARWAGSPSVS